MKDSKIVKYPETALVLKGTTILKVKTSKEIMLYNEKTARDLISEPNSQHKD